MAPLPQTCVIRHLSSHLSQLNWPSGLPPGSRLQEQLRSPPQYIQAVRAWTCHLSLEAWTRSCIESFGPGKLWHTGLYAAVGASAAPLASYPSVSSSNTMRSADISSGRKTSTLLLQCAVTCTARWTALASKYTSPPSSLVKGKIVRCVPIYVPLLQNMYTTSVPTWDRLKLMCLIYFPFVLSLYNTEKS